MIENFINKIISKPESFCHKDGDYLREWQKDLVRSEEYTELMKK